MSQKKKKSDLVPILSLRLKARLAFLFILLEPRWAAVLTTPVYPAGRWGMHSPITSATLTEPVNTPKQRHSSTGSWL